MKFIVQKSLLPLHFRSFAFWFSFIASVSFTVLFLFSPAKALPSISVAVRTVYLNAQTGQWDNETQWIFRQDKEGTVSVTQTGSNEPTLLLLHDASGKLTSVIKRIARGDQFVEIEDKIQGSVVLSSGFPVPYDALDLGNEVAGQCIVSENIGGVTFSSTVTRELVPFSSVEARSAGMLDQTTANNLGTKQLRLITVRKDDNMVVRQLWAAGDSFWLYEETPGRKSWRVY